MKKIHLDQCPSTQEFLMERVKNQEKVDLVSCNKQTKGKGRHNRHWIQFKNTLCFSLVCTPNPVITLTSAEMSNLIAEFFINKFQIELNLKWPNDLMNLDGKKCGGIIINTIGDNCIVGVGLNLFQAENEVMPNFDYPGGFISEKSFSYSPTELAEQITQYIFDFRMKATELIENWERKCIHMNQVVEVTENSENKLGKFIGLGNNGQALLECNSEVIQIYNGNLRFNN